MEELNDYLKNIRPINLKKLEKTIKTSVKEPLTKKAKEYKIIIRENPAFFSRVRINPERELRKIETIKPVKLKKIKECFFCDPKNKCAKFSKKGLKEIYFLNDSVAFSNLFPAGEIHGVIVYNYKKHNLLPKDISLQNWIDGLNLVKEVGKDSKKKYVSSHINYGPKAAASLTHFHGQFHCENKVMSKTNLSMKLTKKLSGSTKKYWKSWIKSLIKENLIIDFDLETKTVFYVEWAPVFSKVELVIMNMENPSFLNLDEKEIKSIAKYLKLGIKTIMENVSDQFNVVNLSAGKKDDFCNQFRIFPRESTSRGIKSWEGYLEFMNETVPHINPKKIAEITRSVMN